MNPILKPVTWLFRGYAALTGFFIGVGCFCLFHSDWKIALLNFLEAIAWGALSGSAFLFRRHMTLIGHQYEDAGRRKLLSEVENETRRLVRLAGVPE